MLHKPGEKDECFLHGSLPDDTSPPWALCAEWPLQLGSECGAGRNGGADLGAFLCPAEPRDPNKYLAPAGAALDPPRLAPAESLPAPEWQPCARSACPGGEGRPRGCPWVDRRLAFGFTLTPDGSASCEASISSARAAVEMALRGALTGAGLGEGGLISLPPPLARAPDQEGWAG